MMDNYGYEAEEDRIIGRVKQPSDIDEKSLRPLKLEDYSGQEKIKKNLKIFIEAAKKRGESLDHVLLYDGRWHAHHHGPIDREDR